MNTHRTLLSIYLHIPFCRHRCAYCDFNTYAGQDEHIAEYVNALRNEIQIVGESAAEKLKVHTIFFGGGTPTLLNASQFESILESLETHFDLVNPEVTIEANPGTVTFETLRDLRSLGINRISFGAQSANPDELRMLERAHTYFDVIHAVTWARRAGFDNLSLDLIFGLPHQALEDWSASVKLVSGLNPDHFSLYALTMEHGTPFGRWSSRGLMPTPNPDMAAEMYEWADEFLSGLGYRQYEISNWTKPGKECVHNLQYWRNLDYLGLGAGAHGYVEGVRYSNLLRIKTYIERFVTPKLQSPNLGYPLTPATVNHHRNTPIENMQETMITGLRLTREGVSNPDFRSRFGQGIEDAFPKEVDELIRFGLLEWVNGKTLRLTPDARLLANQVFMRFVG